jgi:hypothetical protein
MKIFKLLAALLTTMVMFFLNNNVFSCSMYKVTVNDKTMVGSNFDAYYLTPRIWFENGAKTGDYGAAFTGGRFDGSNGFAPQSGMNEFGLTFSRLATPAPEKDLSVATSKKTITNPTNYLKDILHKCKTIDEVKDYINQFDYSFFNEDVFIYIEKSGRYLIVESDTMTIGNESKYVLANFCPSTTDPSIIKQVRYLNGVAFLKNKSDTSISFCTALSDTMHVCRKKIGDGTLLTIIRNLNEGMIYLNFYHDYKHQVKFNLKDELAKGDHTHEIQKLFPLNAEFEKLYSFKIPQNSKPMDLFMRFCAGLFLCSSAFFLVSFFMKKKTSNYAYIKLLLFSMSIILFYYTLVLVSNINIFYFPAPYKDYKFSMLNIAAYVPFLILMLIIPLIILNRKLFKENAWDAFSKWLFTINNITYLTLLILFTYWGLFNILN